MNKVEQPRRSGKKNSKKVLAVGILLLVLALAGTAGWLYKQNRDLKANPAAVQDEKNKAETSRVLDKLKADLLIQETDAPTVARVDDPEKLKTSNAEFYKNVEKNDYLVIYPKRAIIYRESNNQIINIAPIINTADLKADQGTKPAETTTPTTNSTKKTN